MFLSSKEVTTSIFLFKFWFSLFSINWLPIIMVNDSTQQINLFSLYVLFSQYRLCDDTLEHCFFQISSYSQANLRIIYEKTKGAERERDG